MTSVDEHIESIRVRAGDRKSHGCARQAPAGREPNEGNHQTVLMLAARIRPSRLMTGTPK